MRNLLLEALPDVHRQALLAVCEPFEMHLNEVLVDCGRPTLHVVFPIGGYAALLTLNECRAAMEVGMVGHEGMLGVNLALGVSDSPVRALVQGPGPALRLEAEVFRRQMACSSELRHTVERYVYVQMMQQSESVACARFHLIGHRLARWLLMTHDRAQTDHFHVTHELLAGMLGVRRVGITTAAKALQRRGLIAYHRGEVQVLNRAGLEAAACCCYASGERTYRRHLASRVPSTC